MDGDDHHGRHVAARRPLTPPRGGRLMPAGYGRTPVYDTTLGTVHVYTARKTIPQGVRELIDDRTPRTLHTHTGHDAIADVASTLRHGDAAVFYVHGGNDCAAAQRAAISMGARHGAITLPAGYAWLVGKIADITGRGGDVALAVRGGPW